MIDVMQRLTAAKLRHHRKRFGLRQQDLAELAGCDRGWLRQLELGKAPMTARAEAWMLVTLVRFERRAVEAERDSKKAPDG